jgi:hypothetical protein
VTLASAYFKWNARRSAAHFGKEAEKTDDGLELAHLEIVAAGNEHLVGPTVFRDGARNGILAALIVVAQAQDAMAAPCHAPERHFLPQSREDMRLYADLLRADFETYIAEVQTYLRCFDEDRARAFVKAREVVEQYGQL